MNFYTNMPEALVPYYEEALGEYDRHLKAEELQSAWSCLERAHVIGQAYPLRHTQVHWKMLQFGIRIKSRKEVLGQIPRLLVGGVKSFVGRIPVGNTGGANIPPLKPLPFSPEIREIFLKAGVNPPGE